MTFFRRIDLNSGILYSEHVMDSEKILSELCLETESKIVLLVIDGLGDLPADGKTPLEAAHTPNLDRLAKVGACGLSDPVFMGITPGSGPAHLSLFGYDPTKYLLGRGILEALGVDVDVGKNDLVARGNFATLENDLIVDRRAGRIPSSENIKLCQFINDSLAPIKGTQITLFPGKEHRFVVKFTKENLSDALTDADPQKEYKPRPFTQPLSPGADEAASIVNTFLDNVNEILKNTPKANSILLRGFAKYPAIPTMQDLFKLKPAAIAHYPMYRGLAKLVGMNVLEVGPKVDGLVSILKENFEDFNFFYLHIKGTDSAGEDGNYEMKKTAIEQSDLIIPDLLTLKPDVLVITADHSTPCILKSHSWHPNPFLIHAATAQPNQVSVFTERACSLGYLGRFPAMNAMALMLAHAGKLKKFGA